jgi:septal ring factor EnvC (AmiA/AmiB activator)
MMQVLLLLITLLLPFADSAAGESTDGRREALQSQLESVNSEIQAVEEEEARIVKAIDDRKSSRIHYNELQLAQEEQDLAPPRQKLSDIRVKKGALYELRTYLKSRLESTGKRDGNASP